MTNPNKTKAGERTPAELRKHLAVRTAISQGYSNETSQAFAAWIGNKRGSLTELFDYYMIGRDNQEHTTSECADAVCGCKEDK